MKSGVMTVTVRLKVEFSLWEAIKLRIAGYNNLKRHFRIPIMEVRT